MSSTLPTDSGDGLRIVDKVEDNSTSNQMFKSDDNHSLEIRMFEDLAAQQQTMETIRYIAAIVQLLTGIIGIIGKMLYHTKLQPFSDFRHVSLTPLLQEVYMDPI